MSFVFGILIGAMMASSPDSGRSIVGSIPLRCMMALEDGDGTYKACRRLSLTSEMAAQISATEGLDQSGHQRGHLADEVDAALDLEIRALKKMAEESAKRHASVLSK